MTRRAANPGQRPFMVSGDSMRRIAAAVQGYEHGNRNQSAVTFRTATGDEGGDALKLCKTAAAWEYDTIATLDVWHDGTPPTEEPSGETVEAVNKIAKVPADTFVLVGKAENGSWYLVGIGLTKIQVLTDAYIEADALCFDYREVWVVPEPAPEYPITIAGVDCDEGSGS